MNYLQSKERKIKNGSRIEISYATMNELKSSRFFSGDWQTLKVFIIIIDFVFESKKKKKKSKIPISGSNWFEGRRKC